MRRRIKSAMLMIIMVCTLCVNSVVAEAESATNSGDRVTILFTHDIHSRLDEYKASQADGETEMIGGLARIKTEIDRVKEEDPAAFVFDAGDFSMGTLYQTIYETDAAELTMLGKIGVEATTFGNHEFDYRAEGLSNMFHSALRNAEEDAELTLPQFLIANIDWKKNKSDDNKLIQTALEDYGSKEYTVIEHDGVQIGVFGVLGEDAAACAPESGLEFDDIVETSKRVVKELQKKDVDMIVCLSHSGTNEDEDKSEDEILAEKVPEIDVIISGHTHTELKEPIQHGNTYIVSCGEYARNLGSLSMTQKQDGRWEMTSYELIPVSEDIEPDQATQERIDALMDTVDTNYLTNFGYTRDEVLAENDVEFNSLGEMETKHEELNLGDIMSDSYIYSVEHSEDYNGTPVDVAVVPSGCVRDTYTKGNITVEDVYNSFSLGIGKDGLAGYPLIDVYLTGKELKLAAEVDASVSDFMTTARLYCSGLNFTFNPHRMILNKVTDCYLTREDGERIEIQDDQLYRVVTDLYTGQMLGSVMEMSYGLLKIEPKDKDGNPIENLEDQAIMEGDKELKAWDAIARYMKSFDDTDGNGISNVPEYYETTHGRKVVDESRNVIDLVKNPNKFSVMIVGIVLVLILIIILLVVLIRKLIKKRRRKKK